MKPLLRHTNLARVSIVALLCTRTPYANAASTTAPRAPLDACRIVRTTDVFRLLGWHVERVEQRRYRFASLSGTMCNLESSEGIVTTTVPDADSPFPGISADNTPDAADLVENVRGLGAQVQIFNGAIFVTRRKRRVSVRIVPQSHPASYADVEPFAPVILKRFH